LNEQEPEQETTMTTTTAIIAENEWGQVVRDGDKISITVILPQSLIAQLPAKHRPSINPVAGCTVGSVGVSVPDGRLTLRVSDKPGLKVLRDAAVTAVAAIATEKQARLLAAVPGLDELRAAIHAACDDEDRHDRQFNAMMEDGGGRAPQPINPALAERANALRSQYPRAALYLKADGYAGASNHHKAGAGTRAMELLAAGGSEAEAAKILENWLPESATWD
jgi:hypothetical protein